jgi:UDP:flavonoid glycosyltransferase YjiC (YdhE family)
MTKILAYTSPARGHLFPLVPVLETLRARGHTVAVRTLETHVPDLEALGLSAAPLARGVTAIEHDDFKGRNSAGSPEARHASLRAPGALRCR